MRKLTFEDVQGMCTYLHGDQKSVTFYEKFPVVKDTKTHIIGHCTAGTFHVECDPKVLKDYQDTFGTNEAGGQGVIILSDPLREWIDVAKNGFVQYLCFTFCPPKRDVTVIECMRKETFMVGQYGIDSGLLTVFVPVIESTPDVVISVFYPFSPFNEEEETASTSFVYNRY